MMDESHISDGDTMVASVESRAINIATEYYEKRGYTVTNVCRARHEHKGYDLLVRQNGETLKIEVKGSGKLYHGIPDLHGNELDDQLQLIADFLFVCYFPNGLPAKIAVIPRNKIPPNAMQPMLAYCIRSSFKNRSFIESFLEKP